MKKAYKLDFQKIRRKTQIKDFISFELYLKNIFSDLARKDLSEKETKGIDKISFIEYMNIPFIVGEKLFNSLDKTKKGFLTQPEFVNGIISLYVGDLEETQRMIFNILDFDNDGVIIPEDSRLLISFIKNLANPPTNVIKLKMKSCSTITDEENLEEINELINNFFNNKNKMSFEEYKHNIENINSDVFFVFIYFLYNNKPFSDSSIKILKLLNKPSNLASSFSSSVMNTSSEDLNENSKSKVKSPSNAMKNLIFDLVDVDVNEIERDCMEIEDDNEGDVEEYNNMMNEELIEIKIPQFNSKLDQDFKEKDGIPEISQNLLKKNSDKSAGVKINNTKTLPKKTVTKDFLEGNNIDSVHCDDNNNLSINIKFGGSSTITEKSPNSSMKSNNNLNIGDNIGKISSSKKEFKNDKASLNSFNFNDISSSLMNAGRKDLTRNNTLEPTDNSLNLINNSSKNLNLDTARKTTTVSNIEELINPADIVYENYIFKSRSNNKLKKYFIALIGTDLFYFSNSKKTKLKGMHNLSGSYIYDDDGVIKVREETKNTKGILESNTVHYYPFNLHFKKKSRIYYCAKEDECKTWIKHIRNVTKFRDIRDFYSFGDTLGKGKFGSVKCGINKETGRKTAIKTINKSNLKGIETEMVKTEIEIMKFCRHQNIVKCVENFEDLEYIYIILEYLSGGNLNYFLSQQQTILPEEKIKEIIYEIGTGIKYLHHFGILHRDLKPENLMMSEKNYNQAIVKIVDFGLSKILGVTEKSNDAYGTLSYAAPEVIQKTDYNNTIDIWSLGVILYFLICGYLPFNDKNNNVSKIANDITKANVKLDLSIWNTFSVWAKDLTLRCLEKDLNKRINIKEFLEHQWFKEN